MWTDDSPPFLFDGTRKMQGPIELATNHLARAVLLLRPRTYGGAGDWLDLSPNGLDATINGSTFLAHTGRQYCWFPGVHLNYCSVPDFDFSDYQDIEVIAYLAPTTWDADAQIVGDWGTDNTDQSWILRTEVTSTGVLEFNVNDGTGVLQLTTAAHGWVAAVGRWVRVVFVGDDGGGNRVATFYTSTAPADADYRSIVWTLLEVVTVAGTVTPQNLANIVTVGDDVNSSLPYSGPMDRIVVLDGAGGAPLLNIDFNDAAVVEPFATFLDLAGATVTITRTGTTNYVTTVVDEPKWIKDGSNDDHSIGDDPLLDFDLTDSFTLIMRGRIPDGTPAANTSLVSKFTGGIGYHARINTNGSIRWEIDDGAANPVLITGAGLFTANQEFTVALVRDVAIDELRVIFDGVSVGTATDTTTATIANGAAVDLGHIFGGSRYQGELMDFVVFREVLTVTQLAEIGVELGAQIGGAGKPWPDLTVRRVRDRFGNIVLNTDPAVPTYTRDATVVEDRTLLASASASTENNNNVIAALIADLTERGLLS